MSDEDPELAPILEAVRTRNFEGAIALLLGYVEPRLVEASLHLENMFEEASYPGYRRVRCLLAHNLPTVVAFPTCTREHWNSYRICELRVYANGSEIGRFTIDPRILPTKDQSVQVTIPANHGLGLGAIDNRKDT